MKDSNLLKQREVADRLRLAEMRRAKRQQKKDAMRRG